MRSKFRYVVGEGERVKRFEEHDRKDMQKVDGPGYPPIISGRLDSPLLDQERQLSNAKRRLQILSPLISSHFTN
jgi:hypothetical protein